MAATTRLRSARRRSAILSGTSGGVIAALIATVAIVSSGFEAQRADLNDGAVWVASSERQAVGRANLQIGALDTVVTGDGADLEVLHHGADVVVLDRQNATAELLDVARSTVRESVPLPPEEPRLTWTSDSAVVHSGGTGETWVVPWTLFEDFDAATSAPFTFGPGSSLVATDRFGIAAVSPSAGEVYRLLPDRTDRVEESWALPLEADADVHITVAGGRWWVYDADSRLLYREGSDPLSLADRVGPGERVVLGQPTDAAGPLLVGIPSGLLAVSDDGDVQTLVGGRTGEAVAPLTGTECRIAAWSDGGAWRDCSGGVDDAGVILELEGVTATAELTLIERDGRAVLNDRRSGAAWAVLTDGRLIDNWDELIQEEEDERQEELESVDIPPELERTQQPPVAVDDEFGARPGRSTPLPVLLNDSDPNGDVLVVTEVSEIDPDVGRLDIVESGQKVQITLAEGTSGVVSFEYTITDGRGGSDSAIVVVSIRQPSQNAAPVQVRTGKTTVAVGGRVTASVLGEWYDPDGDPIFLQEATIAEPDRVAFRPDGRVTISEAGGVGDVRPVALTVSDGNLTGNGELAVTVRQSGQTPIIADAFAVQAAAGQEVRIEPLRYVRGGTGTIRLTAVPEKAGVTIVPRFEQGFFRFVSDEPRTHYLEYVVTDGDQSATGIIRVDVSAPVDEAAPPITVPKTAFVRSLSSATVAVATTDIDPAGGVLIVTGALTVPTGSGIRAEVIDQRDVRITLTRPLEGPVDVGYRISNGLSSSLGTITVIEIPRPDQLQPPIANDDRVTVRVGDAISIPVLENDEHPDDEPITLGPTLVQGLSGDDGLLFVSGDRLRYLAPDRPGDFTAVYEVLGPLGLERAQATVRISVREVNEATNAPPVTRALTARVIAGETVRIRIPVDSMDPDGDSVQLIGQETSPEKGTVIDSGIDYLDYQAGSYSAGTDTFRYTVVDALGARASGTIRVGISPRLDGARNPVANDDQVTIRPGSRVLVPVLDNDTDPDGSPLSVAAVDVNDEDTLAEIVEGRFVRVTPPDRVGQYGLVYTIENAFGGRSQAFVTVNVVEGAPLTPPLARDVVLSLTDIIDRETVDVDVLARVFFSEGEIEDLGLELIPGFGLDPQVLPDRRIRVSVGERRQIIPFQVIHPEDDSVRGTAFIWVPGTDDTLPQLDRRAPRIQVVSEETVTIPINDYVIAVDGREVMLTDSATVRASNSDGSSLVVDDRTLRFTSADLYFGPASISFDVTDGDTPQDPEGRVSTIVLPIEVTPRENQPPVFIGASLELEPGGEAELDLVRVTSYPYPDDVDELRFTLQSAVGQGLDVTIEGQRATLRVPPATPRGTVLTASVGVRDDAADGTSGLLQVTVVPSTRPLARPAADATIAPRGETTVVDVLANDQATNPFPGQPLRVVAIRGLDDAGLPSGVTLTPSADGQLLRVQVAASAEPSDTTLEYQVADATDDPERYVWGSVRISVQDVPDPVTSLRVQSFADRSLTLAWSPGSSNNAPIERFDAIVTRASDGVVTATVPCAASPCAVPTPGNGPDNRVRLSVVAVNAQGASDPTTISEPTWSDLVPPSATIVGVSPLDGGLRVGWSKPSQAGAASPINNYVVTVGSVRVVVSVNPADAAGTVYWRNVVDAGALLNGTTYSVTVSPRNDAFGPLTSWNTTETSGTPAGPPLRLEAPTASGSTTGVGAGTHTVTVDWTGGFGSNGRSIQNYYVWVSDTGTAPECTVTGVSEGSAQLTPPAGARTVDGATTRLTVSVEPDRTYRAVVYAYNGQGCTASVEVTATPLATPGKVTEVTITGPDPNGTGRWDSLLSAVQTNVPGETVESIRYRLSGGGVDGAETNRRALPTLITAGTSHYGRTVTIQVQACRDVGLILCGAWSDPKAVPVAVLIDVQAAFTASSGPPQQRTYDVSWTPMDPARFPAYATIEYRCLTGSGDSLQEYTADPAGSCRIAPPETGEGAEPGPAEPLNDPRLEVRVTVDGTGLTYTRVYRP